MPIDLEAIRKRLKRYTELDQLPGEWNLAHHDVEDLIAEVERLTRWIPVTERLPEREAWVIVFDPNHPDANLRVWMLQFMDDGGVFWDDEGRSAPTVTHWQPLPEPPK